MALLSEVLSCTPMQSYQVSVLHTFLLRFDAESACNNSSQNRMLTWLSELSRCALYCLACDCDKNDHTLSKSSLKQPLPASQIQSSVCDYAMSCVYATKLYQTLAVPILDAIRLAAIH